MVAPGFAPAQAPVSRALQPGPRALPAPLCLQSCRLCCSPPDGPSSPTTLTAGPGVAFLTPFPMDRGPCCPRLPMGSGNSGPIWASPLKPSFWGRGPEGRIGRCEGVTRAAPDQWPGLQSLTLRGLIPQRNVRWPGLPPQRPHHQLSRARRGACGRPGKPLCGLLSCGTGL